MAQGGINFALCQNPYVSVTGKNDRLWQPHRKPPFNYWQEPSLAVHHLASANVSLAQVAVLAVTGRRSAPSALYS